MAVALILLGGLAAAAVLPPVPVQAAGGLPWTPPAAAYRIKVDADGLYALTYTDLANALLPVDTLDPRSLQLYHMGRPVPIRVTGEADGRFDAADVVLFYGRGVDSLHLDGLLPTNKYTKDNIYWLTYACAAGPCAGPYGTRMAEPDGAIAGAAPAPFLNREHLFKSQWYFSNYPYAHDADHWYADWIAPSVPRTYTIYAYNHTAEALPGSLTLSLLGWGSNAHTLQVWVNNNLVLDGSPGWSGFTEYTRTVEVPRGYFVEGANRIKVGIVLPAGSPTDMVYLNWWDVCYHDTYVAESNVLAFGAPAAGTWRYDVSNFTTPEIEVYDVTDPFAPQRIANTTISAGVPHAVSFGAAAAADGRYFAVAPSAWRKPLAVEPVTRPVSNYRPADLLARTNAADYIIIAHRDFWDQARLLAAYRDREFTVALVDVQQIYDQFNGGLMSAESIRDFLAYARTNWVGSGAAGTPKLTYVLLMGDGTSDMRKYRTGLDTFIPPYLYLADPELGETAADNRFVTISGADNIPDLHIGRFPVNTPAQAQAMVDKTINYETGCACGGWNTRALFVADDLEGGGGDFRYYSNLIADGYTDATNTVKLIPPSFTIYKQYLGSTCDVVGNPSDAAQCRGNIVTELNTRGSLFVSFVGHATKEYWASEHMFDRPAVSALTNGPCLPIMLAMTCYEGSFHDFETPEGLAETSVRRAVSGSVASFSPTGFGLVTGHDYLEKGLMLAWFHKGIDRLGASATYAKQYLVTNSRGAYLDLLDTFLLLGDPALRVKVGEACMLPTAVRMGDFSARVERGAVRVTWQTADESEMAGFNVLRRPVPGMGEFNAINGELMLAAHTGAAAGATYSYLDSAASLGQVYEYQLEIVRLDGGRESYGLAEAGVQGLRLPLILGEREPVR